MSEFNLILDHFTELGAYRADVKLGIGDDAALIELDEARQLVVAVDTLVAGRHFPLQTSAYDIGYKSLAVNLSDLAAMGADPSWMTLALTLPEADDEWLRGFARGLGDLAREYNVALVGGDTTRGPLTVTVQLMGTVPAGEALRRDGAEPGDHIFVSGRIGEAALGLACVQGRTSLPATSTRFFADALNRPRPRLELGRELRGWATSAIDVSDGLLADLSHILAASGVGARVDLAAVPVPGEIAELGADFSHLPLTAGDDYELLFTIHDTDVAEIEALARELKLPLTAIGIIEPVQGMRDVDGEPLHLPVLGYDHFNGRSL